MLGFTGVLELHFESGDRDHGARRQLRGWPGGGARAWGSPRRDGAYDVEGWDSAAKTAALANVLMDARTTPQAVSDARHHAADAGARAEIAREGKTVRLVSRGRRTPGGDLSCACAPKCWTAATSLAATPGTSNLILFHTDLMGTFGTVSIDPGVEQTAYGVFSDLVSLLETIPRQRRP